MFVKYIEQSAERQINNSHNFVNFDILYARITTEQLSHLAVVLYVLMTQTSNRMRLSQLAPKHCVPSEITLLRSFNPDPPTQSPSSLFWYSLVMSKFLLCSLLTSSYEFVVVVELFIEWLTVFVFDPILFICLFVSI